MTTDTDSKPPTLIRVFAAPVKPGYCRGCNASIDWYQTLQAKAMPINAHSKPQKVEVDEALGRRVAFFASADTHWSTCPERARFQKPASARSRR